MASMLALTFFGLWATVAGPVDADPLYLSPESRAFLDSEVRREMEPLFRLQVLLDLIFDEEGLDYSYEAVTRTAEEFFREGSGNCLSFTNFLVAAGRHLDLDVRFREVWITPTWSRKGKLVFFNQHVNAAVVIRGRAYVIDLVPRINRFGLGGKIISDDRGLAHFYNNQGASWFSQESPSQAVKFFKRGLELDPEASFIWANLGAAQVSLGSFSEAEISYRRSLELDRENLVALSNLAALYERLERYREAEELAEKVEQFRASNPYFHFSMGQEAMEQDHPREAAMHFRDAIKREGREHRFHFSLAKALLQLGELKEARKHLIQARELVPDEGSRRIYQRKLQILASGVERR